MRALLAVLLATTALPALADTIPATSRVTAVTLYPDGARITREVTFDAPGAGPHDLLVTDLPAETDASLLRLQGQEGLVFGAFTLRDDRMSPRQPPLTAEQQAAKDALDAAREAEAQAQDAIDAVMARIRAAEAQAGFLTSFNGALPDNATPETLGAMAEKIGAGTLAASETIARARVELRPLERALEKAAEATANAQAAFDALPARDAGYTTLAVSIEAEKPGPAQMIVTHYVQSAGWRPFYDLHLTRGEAAALAIDRSVLVTQTTGEDWTGVDLTLSSSRPSDQAAPSTLWPQRSRIEKEAPPVPDMAEMDMMRAKVAEAPAPMALAEPVAASAAIEGDTVVYPYPRKVNIASGVEDLRLSLDRITAAPDVLAIAVPRMDRSAFVQAEFVNPTAEPILPGEALLFREGVLVGTTSLDLIAPGQKAQIGFGALDTIRISRAMPQRDGGQTGVFSTSNTLSETAILTVENLGDEAWPLRVLDQVPYSEQQDLQIQTSFDPAPDVTDLDGQRGIMAWNMDLAGGQKQQISVGYSLSWPEGMELR